MAAKPTQEQYMKSVSANAAITCAIGSLQNATSHITNKETLKRLKFAIDGMQNELFAHAKIIESAAASTIAIDPCLMGVAKNRSKELADKIRLNHGAIIRAVRSYQLGASPLMPTDADIAAVEAERTELEAELSAINTFMLDGDKSRLSGTALESII